jgi:hypothetical protein
MAGRFSPVWRDILADSTGSKNGDPGPGPERTDDGYGGGQDNSGNLNCMEYSYSHVSRNICPGEDLIEIKKG